MFSSLMIWTRHWSCFYYFGLINYNTKEGEFIFLKYKTLTHSLYIKGLRAQVGVHPGWGDNSSGGAQGEHPNLYALKLGK